jgi:8-oxo-dGTP diphosphatase
MQNIAKTGVGVLIFNENNQLLLGKRHDDPEKADSMLHGEGTWTMVGGKLDFGLKLKDCVIKEAKEETGIDILSNNLELISVTEEILPDVHFVTIGFLCKNFEGTPSVMEPDEITCWKWFDLDNLPKNIFAPSKKLLENYLKKTIF